MKKLFKIIIILVLLTAIGFGAYLYKLRSLAVEGNKLFEYRCTNVNPHLIAYKNSFLGFADYLKNHSKYSDEEGMAFFDGYINGMREYVKEEDKWLSMQSNYVNRWDFKLFEPWYVKQAGEYQIKMFEGYRDDAKYLVAGIDQKEMTEELTSKQKEARDKRNQYIQLYNDFFDKASEVIDWRSNFVSLPLPSGCNTENTTIPDTGGSIDWGNETPQPSAIPFDSERSG